MLEPLATAVTPRTVLMLRLAWQLRNDLGLRVHRHNMHHTCAVPAGEVRLLHVSGESDASVLTLVRRLSAHAGTPMPRVLAVAVDVGAVPWSTTWDAEQVAEAARACHEVGGARAVVLGLPAAPGPTARPIARHNYMAHVRDITAALPLTLMVAPDCL